MAHLQLHASVLLTCLLALATSRYSAEAVSTEGIGTTIRLLAQADDDRLALLCFKSQLSDPTGALASWRSNTSVDICSWHGVTCNNTRQPSRVTELDLESSQLTEYGMGGEISTEGDIYSFGVLLLEMFTGKQPIDEAFNNGTNLHSFVNSSFPDRIGEILDPNIMHDIAENKNQGILIMHNCIIPLMKLGLLCSMEFPKDRPGMRHVTDEIHVIRTTFSNINV
ncbi:putative leucine-rich repeat receptor-like serine/threonine-protein kinase At2g24130 isoform X2 [Setaria italica]|uniref:putative leucine-rich repeat receptor-like serine/threonine-protein kinase At2g24130 isoform X2 n=1 Tax=Setaria italica TaxID=4555 RepID=UPI000645C011|nr:putative leucine-rich repeat receptor-like serine/threonine-protein kinase At2g24130 isoform X2 [Setaria italica]